MSRGAGVRARARLLWILVPPLTLGWLAGPAFLYAGRRARHRAWVVAGIIFLATGFGGFALVGGDQRDGPLKDAGTLLVLGTWGSSTAYAFAVRGRFLALAYPPDDDGLAEAERRLDERRRALAIAAGDPLRARELGIGRPDLPDAYSGGLIDLNHAPAATIAGLPRLGPELAERLVAVRAELQGFVSLEDAGQVLDLPPATVERLRGLAVCLPY